MIVYSYEQLMETTQMATTSKTITGEFRTKVYFAHVQEPSQYGNYEINLAVTPEIEKKLIELRLDKKIKDGKERINNGGKFLTLRNAAIDLGGFESEMVVIDQNGKRTKSLIGNDSECIVYWRSYDTPKYGKVIKLGKMIDWDEENKKKKFGTLKIVELVEYASPVNEFAAAMDAASEGEDPFPKSELPPPAEVKAKSKKVTFEIEA
jgi:hypothetical protein